MENIGVIIAGGLYMILSKDTVEKMEMDKRTGIPYYKFVNKKLGWALLLSGVFCLVIPIMMILILL